MHLHVLPLAIVVAGIYETLGERKTFKEVLIGVTRMSSTWNQLKLLDISQPTLCVLHCLRLEWCRTVCFPSENKCALTDIVVSPSYQESEPDPLLMTCYSSNVLPDYHREVVGVSSSPSYPSHGPGRLLDGICKSELLDYTFTYFKTYNFVTFDLGKLQQVSRVLFFGSNHPITVYLGNEASSNGNYSGYEEMGTIKANQTLEIVPKVWARYVGLLCKSLANVRFCFVSVG